MVGPILVGPAERIRIVAQSARLDIEGIEIVDVPHSEAAAEKAVELEHSQNDRKTSGFPKKLENHVAAIQLHITISAVLMRR
jgi:phosphotransacetylase